MAGRGVLSRATPLFYATEVLHTLVERGNTVAVIEHNMEVIKTADHLIDLGPEGGVNGGLIIAQGKPEEVARVKESHTGRYLKTLLSKVGPTNGNGNISIAPIATNKPAKTSTRILKVR